MVMQNFETVLLQLQRILVVTSPGAMSTWILVSAKMKTLIVLRTQLQENVIPTKCGW